MGKCVSYITLEASLENLEAVHSFIHAWAEEASLSINSTYELLLAVEEAYVNVVKYAYPDSSGKVTISCHMREDSLILEIKDGGIPFDPLKLPQPNLSPCLEKRKIGGLGIFLLRRLMDKVEYERQGTQNALTLVKCRKKV